MNKTIQAAAQAAQALRAARTGFRAQVAYEQQVALMREAVRAADLLEYRNGTVPVTLPTRA